MTAAVLGEADDKAGPIWAMDGFVSVQASTLSPPEFFAPENVGRIMSRAGATA